LEDVPTVETPPVVFVVPPGAKVSSVMIFAGFAALLFCSRALRAASATEGSCAANPDTNTNPIPANRTDPIANVLVCIKASSTRQNWAVIIGYVCGKHCSTANLAWTPIRQYVPQILVRTHSPLTISSFFYSTPGSQNSYFRRAAKSFHSGARTRVSLSGRQPSEA
jgi:hypothetical protein